MTEQRRTDRLKPFVRRLELIERDIADTPTLFWARVTQTDPLRIKIDGDEEPLLVTPATNIPDLQLGEKVYVSLQYNRVTIINVSGRARRQPATQQQVDAGTNTSNYVTPETLAGRTMPFGHKGKTGGFQATSSVVVVGMGPAQVLAGGMSENTNALIVPRAGKYLLTARFYSTGSSGFVAVGYLRHTGEVSALSVDTWKANGNDYMFMATGIRQLNAGDQVWLEHTGGGSTWGTNGWNGAWVEALWIGP